MGSITPQQPQGINYMCLFVDVEHEFKECFNAEHESHEVDSPLCFMRSAMEVSVES